jgi:hypothetical protein
MKNDQEKIFTYLLHFDRTVSGKDHYLGSCEMSQLSTRMRRHQLGTASSLTKRVHEAQVGFILAALYQSEDRSLEKKLKWAGHYRGLCCVCSQGGMFPQMFTNVLYYPPVARITPTTVLSF